MRDDSDFQDALESDRDDLLDAEEVAPVPTSVVRDALLRVVREIQRRVVSPAPARVEPASHDGRATLSDPIGDAVAAIVGGAKAPRALPALRYPIFDAAHQKFLVAMPPPWILRVDDDASYEAWRAERREPYLEALAERVAALEEVLADHVSDDHAGRIAQLERDFDRHVAEHGQDLAVLGEEVARAKDLAEVGGERVPVSVEPSMERSVACWQDGEEVLCTLFYCAPDGTCRALTAGTLLADHLDPAVRHVVDAGVDPLEIAPVFSRVVQVYAFSILLPRIAAVAPDAVRLASGATPFSCRVVSSGDPVLAAAMSLAQRAQGGDADAMREVKALRQGGGKALIAEADRQIAAAKKARTR